MVDFSENSQILIDLKEEFEGKGEPNIFSIIRIIIAKTSELFTTANFVKAKGVKSSRSSLRNSFMGTTRVKR